MSKFTPAIDRRRFLGVTAGLAVGGPLSALAGRSGRGGLPRLAAAGYGPLAPVRDETTGLPLLSLPPGFRYLSFGWHGDLMTDGRPTPAAHDGMAAFPAANGRVSLVRNHEIDNDTGVFGAAPAYDEAAQGGTTTVDFDPGAGRALETRPSLCGTIRNCAGGPTPWGTWLTCEETLTEPRSTNRRRQPHGYVFEVPHDGVAAAEPLSGLGRFVHEAVAIDPADGIVYLTEDHVRAGFYRFVPRTPGRLGAGGRLEMLAISGRARFDTRTGVREGSSFSTFWVPIEEPERPHHDAGRGDGEGVSSQGWDHGAAVFGRLEGAWHGNGAIYFDATNGGDAGVGQVWEYTPESGRLRLLFQSPGPELLNMPDNLTVSPRGGVVLCEDGSGPARMHGLTVDGRIFPFVGNNVVLDPPYHGLRGDFRDREFAGVCYSPDGRWLFFNIQTPGITFAVTGAWAEGRL
jgi:uncharacterized protein